MPAPMTDLAHRVQPMPYRWVMLGMIWLAYASFGMVSSSLAPVVTQIASDLRLSYSQIGTILGAWQLTYIGVAFIGGRIIDRIGLRRALGFGLLVIAASAVLRGAATDFWTLFGAVALFGVGGPMVSIGAPKLVATWFLGPERGKAAGIYTTGSALGGVIVLSLTNSVLLPLTGTWRLTVAAFGVVALVVCALWWGFAREPQVENASRVTTGGGVVQLLHIRNVWLVLVIGFSAFLSGHGLRNWLPKILEWHGYAPVDAGFWASIPNLIGIVAALVITRVVKREHRAHAIGVMFAINAVSLMLIGVTSGPILVLCLVLLGFVLSSLTPLLLLVIMDTPRVGAAAMGTAGGLYFTVGEIGGFAGPSLMGLLFDVTGGFVVGLTLIAVISIAMAFASLALDRNFQAA